MYVYCGYVCNRTLRKPQLICAPSEHCPTLSPLPSPSAPPPLIPRAPDLLLTRFSKANTSPDELRLVFILKTRAYGSELDSHGRLQTSQQFAFAVVMDDVTTVHHITVSASVYTAEAVAIRRALCDLQHVRDCCAFVICSDVLSVPQTIANCRVHDPLIAYIDLNK